MSRSNRSSRPRRRSEVPGEGSASRPYVITAVVLAAVGLVVAAVAFRPSGGGRAASSAVPDAPSVAAPAAASPATGSGVSNAASPGDPSTWTVDDVAPGFETYVPDVVAREPQVIAPREGAPGFTYRFPVPGDPDYEDYLRMIRHPAYARFNTPGSVQWYDPEWRSVVRGRREVPKNDLRLIDGTDSVEDLLKQVLIAVHDGDKKGLNLLRLERDEFQLLCWPEFPQSRPALRIPPDEAWVFQFTSMNKGATKTLTNWGGRNLSLVGFRNASVKEFTNFRILDGVTMTVEDADTGEQLDLDIVEAVIECRGRYKVYMYKS